MPERLLKYYRPYRKTLFFALLGSVITSALDLCFPLFMRYILGDVLTARRQSFPLRAGYDHLAFFIPA